MTEREKRVRACLVRTGLTGHHVLYEGEDRIAVVYAGGNTAALLASAPRLAQECSRYKAEVERLDKGWAAQVRRTLRAEYEVERLKAKIDAALALHAETDSDFGLCDVCDVSHPCPTAKALKGENNE